MDRKLSGNYVARSVIHMLNGHAYARAIRAHLLTSAVLSSMLIFNHDEFNDDDRNETFTSLCENILKGICDTDSVLADTAVQQLMTTVANLMEEERKKSRAGRLWISYMEQVSILKMFLYAERTADWSLHLHCIRSMIPYFHAAEHLSYAKCARLYLQQMKSLQSTMSGTKFKQFTDEGYFTIRRTDRFWSGNFTDQVIEQDLI